MERRAVACASGGAALLFAGFGYARYATFHNRTFDLAFYTRMAWGLVRGELWDPVVGGHVLGLHVSPVLAPIGLLGAIVGTAPALIVAQALALALAAFPLARMGARKLGPGGAVVGALLLLLHPNLGHVATYEVHPGTLAVLPLAFLVDALDRGDGRGLRLAALGALLCREDLALLTGVAGLVHAFGGPRSGGATPSTEGAERRRDGLVVALGSFAYLGLYFGLVHPWLKPPSGSMEAHFGRWGGSASSVALAWLTHPGAVLEHLGAPERLRYLPWVTGSLLFLPLLSPRFLLLAAPVLGVSLLSDFPTTTRIESHYLTAALPALVGGALDVAGALAARGRLGARPLALALLTASGVASWAFGALPPARGFDSAAFTPGPSQAALERLVGRIPSGASVQAPDPLLPHLAERRRVHRGPPPERGTAYVVLDLGHRDRYAHREDLLRTTEEPGARAWLAREDHHVVDRAGPYLLLAQGPVPHGARIASYRSRSIAAPGGQRLAGCLSLVGARRSPVGVRLELEARGPCPSDLAIRIGAAPRPRRVELLFDGVLSPAHLRRGDRLFSDVALEGAPGAIYVGALRSSGARPEPSDPRFVRVELTR
jgi:uncharacterized membrane protein